MTISNQSPGNGFRIPVGQANKMVFYNAHSGKWQTPTPENLALNVDDYATMVGVNAHHEASLAPAPAGESGYTTEEYEKYFPKTQQAAKNHDFLVTLSSEENFDKVALLDGEAGLSPKDMRLLAALGIGGDNKAIEPEDFKALHHKP